MRAYVGAGWHIHHITDRVVELRKDDHAYRRLTGADGFVKMRVEPGMTRATALEKAVEAAQKCDEELSFRVAKQLIPKPRNVGKYRMELHRMEKAFGIGNEDEKYVGRMRP